MYTKLLKRYYTIILYCTYATSVLIFGIFKKKKFLLRENVIGDHQMIIVHNLQITQIHYRTTLCLYDET